MKKEKIDLTKRVYTIQGTNVCFSSRGSLINYLHKKWGVKEGQMAKKMRSGINPDDFKDKACNTGIYKFDEHEAIYVERLLVSTPEQIDACFELGFLE